MTTTPTGSGPTNPRSNYPVTKIPRKRWKGIIDRVSGELRVTPGEVYAVLSGVKGTRYENQICDHIEQYVKVEKLYDESCATFMFCLEEGEEGHA